MFHWIRGGRKQEWEQIQALVKAVDDLKRDAKVIRLEWEDVYDRLTRTMGRLNARIRKSESLTPPESDNEDAPHTPDPPTTNMGAHAKLVEMRAKHRVLHG